MTFRTIYKISHLVLWAVPQIQGLMGVCEHALSTHAERLQKNTRIKHKISKPSDVKNNPKTRFTHVRGSGHSEIYMYLLHLQLTFIDVRHGV